MSTNVVLGQWQSLGLCQGVHVVIRVILIYMYTRVIYVCSLEMWQIYALLAKRVYMPNVSCLKLAYVYAFCSDVGPSFARIEHNSDRHVTRYYLFVGAWLTFAGLSTQGCVVPWTRDAVAVVSL
jgi:hypothetical protein